MKEIEQDRRRSSYYFHCRLINEKGRVRGALARRVKFDLKKGVSTEKGKKKM